MGLIYRGFSTFCNFYMRCVVLKRTHVWLLLALYVSVCTSDETSDDLKMMDKTAAPSAVQLNIVGRDGNVGPPLFISSNICGRYKNGTNPAIPVAMLAQAHNVSQLKCILWVYMASCI